MAENNNETEKNIINDNKLQEEEIENLSVSQINELFNDIIELPDDYFLAAASTSSKHCHNSRC